MATIDKINYAGETYKFVDSETSEKLVVLSGTVDRLFSQATSSLQEEVARAEAAESAISQGKVDKITGKGLSTNDFTDEHKQYLDTLPEMVGATATTGGSKGLVPAPQAGDNVLYLDGTGHWSIPRDSKYDKATPTEDGLMAKEDKAKLDGIKNIDYELNNCTTQINGDQIIQTYASGKSKIITFNADGSISEKITEEDGTEYNATTTFNGETITRIIR